MLCHVASICTIYCITDWFLSSHVKRLNWWGFLICFTFISFYIMSPDHKKAIYQKIIIKFRVRDSKTKDKFLTTTPVIFFINNKRFCTYFNPAVLGGSNRSSILKQAYSQKLLFLSMLYLLRSHEKEAWQGGTVKDKSFWEFLILTEVFLIHN